MGKKQNATTMTETDNTTISLTPEQVERIQAILDDTKDKKQTWDNLVQTIINQGCKVLEKRREKRDNQEPTEAQIAKAQAILAKANKAA